MQNYLVLLSAHINTQERLLTILEQINSLNSEKIDVCLCINSNKYLDILTEKVKYLVYDSNNEFLDYQTYLSNPTLASGVLYGSMNWNIQLENITAHMSGPTLITPYSKPALLLFRNGVNIAYINGYKWTVYLEWDIPIPKNGFRYHFDNIISKLENEKKDALLFTHNYVKESTYLDFLWHGLFVVNSSISNIPILNENWHVNTEQWLKVWGGSFFEYIVQNIIQDYFKKNIIIEDIKTFSKNAWGTEEYIDLQKSIIQYATNKIKINRQNPEAIHIFPKKQNDTYELYLFIIITNFRFTDSDIFKIKNLKVLYDNQCVVYHESFIGNINTFYFEKLPEYKTFNKVEISYETDKGNGYENYKEFYYTKDIPQIYSNIFRVV